MAKVVRRASTDMANSGRPVNQARVNRAQQAKSKKKVERSFWTGKPKRGK